MDTVMPMENLAKETMLDGNFVRGEVEDLLTISHDGDAVWEEDSSDANWILMGKYSKVRKEGSKKDEEISTTKNNKKGPNLKKGEPKKLKGRFGCLSSMPIGTTLKNGDVGSSPSLVGR